MTTHHVAFARGAHDERKDAHFIDAERGIYLVAAGRGAAGAFGTSQVIWTFEEAADGLRAKVAEYERSADAEMAREVTAALERVITGLGPDLLAALPGSQPATSLACVLVGPGFAFAALHGAAHLFVLRRGALRQVSEGRASTEVFPIELLGGDRLVLVTEQVDGKVKGDATQVGDDLLAAARAAGAEGDVTVVVIDPPTSAADEQAQARTRALGKLFLFEGLSFEARQRVHTICRRRAFLPGHVIVREGEPGDAMFVVVRGNLRVTLDGKELTRLGPGANFGELSLADGSPRSATITGIDDGDLIVIQRKDLEAFTERRPEIGAAIAWRLVEWLAKRVRDLSDKVAHG